MITSKGVEAILRAGEGAGAAGQAKLAKRAWAVGVVGPAVAKVVEVCLNRRQKTPRIRALFTTRFVRRTSAGDGIGFPEGNITPSSY
jgi:hypothetical protein